jgi:hypothetical protein
MAIAYEAFHALIQSSKVFRYLPPEPQIWRSRFSVQRFGVLLLLMWLGSAVNQNQLPLNEKVPQAVSYKQKIWDMSYWPGI